MLPKGTQPIRFLKGIRWAARSWHETAPLEITDYKVQYCKPRVSSSAAMPSDYAVVAEAQSLSISSTISHFF
jgi:hypothetical protein